MDKPAPKLAVIIAGPNGAGKSTFAHSFLVQELGITHFFNADLIAAGIAPLATSEAAQVRAGRVLLEMVDATSQRGESFAVETTLSGHMYVDRIKTWRAQGHFVCLVYLSLQTVEESIERVRLRVRQGGHDVPEESIRRRFDRSRDHFEEYKAYVDQWILYDNSGSTPTIIGVGQNDGP